MHSAQCAFFFVSPFSSTSSMLRIDVSIVFHLLFKDFDLFSSVVATRRVAHLKQLECLIWKKNMSSSILGRFFFSNCSVLVEISIFFLSFCNLNFILTLRLHAHMKSKRSCIMSWCKQNLLILFDYASFLFLSDST